MTVHEQPVALRPAQALSRTQELIWLGERLVPDAPIANMATVSRFDGAIDPARFVAAVDQAVRAHEALRTVFLDVAGSAHVKVVPSPPTTTEVVEIAAAEVDGWIESRISKPLDVANCSYDSVLIDSGGAWIWLMNVHHLVIDATSSAIVFQAVAAAYRGQTTIEPSSFAGHLGLLQQRQSNPRWRKASEHWAAVERRSRAPQLYSSAEAPDADASRVQIRLSDDEQDRLDELLEGELRSLSAGLGLAAILAAATAVYRSRLTGELTTVFGVPIHNRDRQSLTVVGPLIELFPMELRLAPDDTFRAVHKRALRALFDVMGNAQPETSPAQSFDVVLNVSTAQFGMFGDIKTRTEWIPSGAVDPNHGLRVQSYDWDGQGELQIALDINHSVASSDQIALAGMHFGSVLRALMDDLDSGIGEFSILADGEAEQLDRYNETIDVDARETTVVEQVRTRLNLRRDEIVVDDGSVALTGGEFLKRVDGVAATLVEARIGREDIVGICLPGSLDAVIAIHAVLRAGAAFTPIDPSYPRERQRHIREDAGLALVIDRLPDVGASETELVFPDLGDVAYVIYTSGSTGLAKGVPITHRGLADYLHFAGDSYLTADASPTVALFSSLSFDLTITSLFLPMLVGGMLRVHESGGVPALGEIVAERQVDFLKATPSHLELLLRLDRDDDGLDIRTLIVGGEAFTTDLGRRLAKRYPIAQIFNEYGPTEAVVGCMVYRFADEFDRGPAVPIGRPAPGVRLFVLDEFQQLAPVGVAGELYIARSSMASGYLNRPELTAERFVQLPGIAEGLLYRTGDKVILNHGEERLTMVYLGRVDEQIKAQGVRLEPGEVEAAINSHPAIAQSAVRLWSAEQASTPTARCPSCGLPNNVPGAQFDGDGVCQTCRHYESVKEQASSYFRTVDDLRRELDDARTRSTGEYDVLHLLSGGKDSTYALYRLVDLGARVRTMTLDNGFISDGALDNVRRAVADLGIDHEFVTTDAMNEIFRDSLERFSNVCNGCYKTIYTLSVNIAHELGIPLITTGLSRGQLFETRLTPGQFSAERFDPDAIDRAVLEARKVYHRTEDAVSKLLDVSLFETDEVFDQIRFLDFYRYFDVELSEMLRFLDDYAPWIRPADTGRSTNCLINAAGISVHRMEQGFHNYAVPYSWDVKLGHKTRAEALEELDDPVDDEAVEAILDEIGYVPRPAAELTAWFVQAPGTAPVDIDDLRQHVATLVPAHALPGAFVAVDEIALSPNGKVATGRLPAPTKLNRLSGQTIPASTPVEETIAAIWAEVLGLEAIGIDNDFFELGGNSLRALEMIVWVSNSYELAIPEVVAFQKRTIRALAIVVERLVLESIVALDDGGTAAELSRVDD
ncbi:MAG: amino acid adenylation domain-containing protein [Acidimicrobiales bacterium]